MSIPIIWPKDMEDKPTDNENITIVKKEPDEPDKTNFNEPEEPEKPKPPVSIEESNLFNKPIEFNFAPDIEQEHKTKKKKYCGRDCIKNGETKKCKEPTETCPFHICQTCKDDDLTTDQCPHKLTHNFDRLPPRLKKETGAEHLYNLQFSCYLTMETLLARTGSNYRVDGLTHKLEEKRDAYKACLEEIYDEYGSEIDQVVSPVMTWAMLTSVDIGTSVYENKKKEHLED